MDESLEISGRRETCPALCREFIVKQKEGNCLA
jgi:hypothetical protein